MNKLSSIIELILQKKFLKKFSAYALLILAFFLFQDLLIIFFLTFIFSYLIFSIGTFLKEKFDIVIEHLGMRKSIQKLLKQAFSLNVVIFIEYVLLFIFLIILFSQILPQLIKELYSLGKTLPFLQYEIQNITGRLEEIRRFNTELGGSITQIITAQDFEFVKDIFLRIKGVGAIFLEVFLGLVLSVVFLFDREKLLHYLSGIKKSHFRFFYDEYELIFERGVKSFGVILKAQSMIAMTNAILTTLGLFIIGGVYGNGFPFILSLGLCVFLFGFIPVLGTFLSSIPLIVIAYLYVGGFNASLTVASLVIIIHALEAYYLNPKIFASFLELPMSLTFIILIISEYFFGIAGLLIGVSIFYFFVGVLSDINKQMGKTLLIKKRS